MKRLICGIAVLLLPATLLYADSFPRRSSDQHRPSKLQSLIARSPVKTATIHCIPMLDGNGQQMLDEYGNPDFMCWDEPNYGGGGEWPPCMPQHNCNWVGECAWDTATPYAGCYIEGAVCSPCY